MLAQLGRAARGVVQGSSRTLRSSQQKRQLGGGAHAHEGNPDDYVTYAGVTIKKPDAWEVWSAQLMGGAVWFWIFYRFYHDWDEKVMGLSYVLDNDPHGDEEDDGHHSHSSHHH